MSLNFQIGKKRLGIRRGWIILTGILVFALALRLPLLTSSFWLDEAAQALESARPLEQQLALRPDFQPPLLHLILHAAIQISQSEWWLRTVGALIPALLTLIVTFKIGELLPKLRKSSNQSDQSLQRALPDWSIGVVAAVLLATSSLHIFYSQELRQYSLAVFWAVVSWYSLLLLVTQPTAQARGIFPKASRVFSLATVAGLYSMYLYPFVLLSQVVIVWFYFREHSKKILLAASIAVLGFLPWLPSFWGQLQEGQSVRERLPGWEDVVGVPQLKALPLVLGKFIFGVVDISISPLFILVTTGVVISLALALLLSTKKDKASPFFTLKNVQLALRSPSTGVLLWSVLIPIGTAWLISFVIPVLQPKRLLMVLPLLYLFIAFVSAQLPKQYARLGYAIIVGILSVNLIGTYQYFTNQQLQRENWKALHQEVTEKYTRNTIAVFGFDEPFAPWIWYDDGGYPTLATGSLIGRTSAEVAQALAPAYEYQFVLVFDYLRDITDPQRSIEATLTEWGYEEVGILQRPQIGFVRIYARPTAVLSYTNDLSRH